MSFEKGSPEETQVSESIQLKDGSVFIRIRDITSGVTCFRREKDSQFQEWTFNQQKQLISSYKGVWTEMDTIGKTQEFQYAYNDKGKLISAQETKTSITPENETKQVLHHPIVSDYTSVTARKMKEQGR